MIPAEKSPLVERVMTAYFTRRLRHRFAAVHLKGAENVPVDGGGVPVVLYANHPGWWDAVLPLVLSRKHFRHDAYAMMEEEQVARYGFFRKVGCFSVVRENPRAAMRSLQYAADLLRGSSRALWVFPQGVLTSAEKRPLRFYTGTARLLRDIGEVIAIPVAFRYEFVEDELPEAFIACGSPWHIRDGERVDIRLTTGIMEQLLNHEMLVQREDVMERDLSSYTTILTGKQSINQWWDGVRGKN
ncbi:MAG: lysophospholipid acyltransferase family protein [Bacteroidetes bacterium]|nr:lysophospholipid acyltransferase family protein [Bacteroidota bacterium]